MRIALDTTEFDAVVAGETVIAVKFLIPNSNVSSADAIA